VNTVLLILSVFISTISIEILIGIPYPVMLHRIFSPKKREHTLLKSSNIITRGDDALLVLEYVPNGWDQNKIKISENSSLDISEVLKRASTETLPSNREEILRQIEAERRKFTDSVAGEWNGARLGIESITLSRTANEEHPTLHVKTFPSDYASKLAIERLIKNNPESKLPLATNVSELSSYRLHSLGLNATVVTADNLLVLSKRSKKINSARGGLHISVNEGMVAEDKDLEGNLSPTNGLMRGLKEELGITAPITSITFHSALVDLNRYELGLLAHVDLRGSKITGREILLRQTYALSQDRFENQALMLIPWNIDEIIEILKEPDWIAHGWLNLFYSAYSAFPESRHRLYLLLETMEE
jgi:hypothetical protein